MCQGEWRADRAATREPIPVSVRDFIRNMASENSREALGGRNAFSYVDIGRVRGFEPKKRFRNLIQAFAIINNVSLRT